MRSSKKYDSILSEVFIESICDLMEVEHHHHDLFDEPRYKDGGGCLTAGLPGGDNLSKAICVIYSSQFGSWQMAINYDGTISVPYDRKLAAEWTLKFFLPLRKKETEDEN